MARFELKYLGGPLDGDIEVRDQPPQDGDPVHRLVGGKYVEYRWSFERRCFIHRELATRGGMKGD